MKEYNENLKNNKGADLRGILTVGDDVLEKMEGKLETLKEVFNGYSRLGDKLNFNKLSVSSFLKFLKDCDVLSNSGEIVKNKKETEKTFDMFSNRSMSKSPLKSVLMSSSNSTKTLFKRNSFHSNNPQGKISENDAKLIFTELTGNKNFNNKEVYKRKFDKNRGFSMDFNEAQKSAIFDHSKSFAGTKSNVVGKMDFNLFLKSFEMIACKIYPNQQLDDAVMMFIEKVLYF
jgi:hypothetical protein